MTKFKIQKLAGIRRGYDTADFQTKAEAVAWADAKVRNWHAHAYRGGCQLTSFFEGRESLEEVYGKDFA
jgi:hypothetical protein